MKSLPQALVCTLRPSEFPLNGRAIVVGQPRNVREILA